MEQQIIAIRSHKQCSTHPFACSVKTEPNAYKKRAKTAAERYVPRRFRPFEFYIR